jgi:glycine/D-amino acid oxidase-like deaminating enzyme
MAELLSITSSSFYPTMPQILPVPKPTPSYWLSQPHKHHDLRSTPDLPAECDIAIIGSGMSGIATAYHIFRAASYSSAPPPRVVIFEARDLCSGATARNGGHSKTKINTLTAWLQKGQMDPRGVEEVVEYGVGIVKGMKQVVEEEGLECEYEVRGSMDVFLDADEAEEARGIYDDSRREDDAWTRRFSWVLVEHVYVTLGYEMRRNA